MLVDMTIALNPFILPEQSVTIVDLLPLPGNALPSEPLRVPGKKALEIDGEPFLVCKETSCLLGQQARQMIEVDGLGDVYLYRKLPSV